MSRFMLMRRRPLSTFSLRLSARVGATNIGGGFARRTPPLRCLIFDVIDERRRSAMTPFGLGLNAAQEAY